MQRQFYLHLSLCLPAALLASSLHWPAVSLVSRLHWPAVPFVLQCHANVEAARVLRDMLGAAEYQPHPPIAAHNALRLAMASGTLWAHNGLGATMALGLLWPRAHTFQDIAPKGPVLSSDCRGALTTERGLGSPWPRAHNSLGLPINSFRLTVASGPQQPRAHNK